MDSMGITVTAAVLPARRDAVDMIKGIPSPLENPIRTDPVMVPAQPPEIRRERYPRAKSTGAASFTAEPSLFFTYTKDRPPKKATRSIPAIITAIKC